MSRVILLIGLCLCYLPAAKAQTSSPESSEVLRQLLSMPAPKPRTAAAILDTEKTPKQRAPQFFDKDKAPPDDAPIEDLLEYWNRWADTSGRPDPSEPVKQRLLDACLADPETLPRFLSLLSETEATAAKVKELYARSRAIRKVMKTGARR